MEKGEIGYRPHSQATLSHSHGGNGVYKIEWRRNNTRGCSSVANRKVVIRQVFVASNECSVDSNSIVVDSHTVMTPSHNHPISC